MSEHHTVLQLKCLDQPGIVAAISQWVTSFNGNITRLDQYSLETDGMYFMRVEFTHQHPITQHEAELQPILQRLNATCKLHAKSWQQSMGIFVSQHDHCLYDLLYHNRVGDLPVKIPMIISNHEVCRELAEFHQIPFHYCPINQDKRAQEAELLELISQVDFLVLARYMQILSEDFLNTFGRDVINIHHSFLPSFIGANPYRQAYQRGVKVIGATAHYVTQDLDEGPIICQQVSHISHHDTVEQLKRKGKSLENETLRAAIQAHIDYRVFRHENKTIVFS